jgi:hypothetical protein
VVHQFDHGVRSTDVTVSGQSSDGAMRAFLGLVQQEIKPLIGFELTQRFEGVTSYVPIIVHGCGNQRLQGTQVSELAQSHGCIDANLGVV